VADRQDYRRGRYSGSLFSVVLPDNPLVGKFKLGLGVEALRTLSVVAIVYGSQATIYAIRDRHHFWGLRPTLWLLLSSIADLLIISTLATLGFAMARIKIPVFSRLGIS
jgi:H+-transporting ATPase